MGKVEESKLQDDLRTRQLEYLVQRLWEKILKLAIIIEIASKRRTLSRKYFAGFIKTWTASPESSYYPGFIE